MVPESFIWHDPLGLRCLLREDPPPRSNPYQPLGMKPRPPLLDLPGEGDGCCVPELLTASPDDGLRPSLAPWPQAPTRFCDSPPAAAPPGKHPLSAPRSPPKKYSRTDSGSPGGATESTTGGLPRADSLTFPSSPVTTDELYGQLSPCCTPNALPSCHAGAAHVITDAKPRLLPPTVASPQAPLATPPPQESAAAAEQGARAFARQLSKRALFRKVTAMAAPAGAAPPDMRLWGRQASDLGSRRLSDAQARALAIINALRRQPLPAGEQPSEGIVSVAVLRARIAAVACQEQLLCLDKATAGAPCKAGEEAEQEAEQGLEEPAPEDDMDQWLLDMIAPLARGASSLKKTLSNVDRLPALLWSYVTGARSPIKAGDTPSHMPRQGSDKEAGL